jgi:formamidopyrimidine-DNA glycosylase
MPELPEVQTVVNTLAPRVTGQRITRVTLGRRDILTPSDFALESALTGHRIRGVERRAKRIVFTLDDANRFYIHLGMSGRLGLNLTTEDLKPHTHLRIELEAPANHEIRFTDPRRFGGIWWLGQADDPVNTIGPEPLTLRPAVLAKRLSATTRAIKNALLDQRLIAGLGNIYVDESLFEAQIHPQTPADKLTPAQVARLTKAIKLTLKRALRHRGSTLRDYRDAAGNPGDFQNLHRVYGRESEPCKRCRQPIQRIVMGGRSTHFCAKCQPAVGKSRR